MYTKVSPFKTIHTSKNAPERYKALRGIVFVYAVKIGQDL